MHPRFEWANTLRGFAALSVVVFHYGVVFWTEQETAATLARRPMLYPADTAAPRTARILSALPIDLGAFGVATFFLLSGFVIAISVDKYSRRGFVVGRFLRVLPVYAAGYLITCTVIAVVGDPQHELNPASVLAGTVPGLSFLLGVSSPGDGIVWTLIVELIFYLVCLLAYRTVTRAWQTIATVAIACVLVQVLVQPPAVLVGSSLGGLRYLVLLAAPFLPVMLIGVTLSGRSRGQISPAAAYVLVPWLTAVHLWLMSTTPVVPTSWTYKLTFLGAIAMFSAIWAWGSGWERRPFTHFVAGISYPLYVVHPVLGYALLSVLAEHHVRVPLAMMITATVALLAAWLLHHVIEVPTHRLGQRWSRRFSSGRTTEGTHVVTARRTDLSATVSPAAAARAG